MLTVCIHFQIRSRLDQLEVETNTTTEAAAIRAFAGLELPASKASSGVLTKAGAGSLRNGASAALEPRPGLGIPAGLSPAGPIHLFMFCS